jgi:beta-galactosidase/beta-glucuronidase
MDRELLTLDGQWLFQVDRDEQGKARGWHEPSYQPDGWREVEVPSNWDTYLDGLFGFAGHAWYRRRFSADPRQQGSRAHLRFEGANYETTVWLNGKLLGVHRGGFDPFVFDVTGKLDLSGDNTLAVRVDNWPKLNRVPNSLGGWWNYGGIYRSVKLLSVPAVRIDDVFVRAEPGQGSAGAPLVLTVTVVNESEQTVEVTVSAAVSRDDKAVALDGELATPTATVPPGEQIQLTLEATIPGAWLWSPDEPNLYVLHVSLGQRNVVLDAQDVSFGVRKFEAHGTRFYLNGEPITLTGFNRHEEYAGSGRVDPGGVLETDLRLIKEMNGNTVRMHYQAHPDLYELADRIGLLVFAEIPLWGVGNRDVAELSSQEVRETAETMLRTLIGELRNHPSVIIWSVGNESATRHIEARPLIGHLVDVTRSLDTTRPVAYVGMFGPDEECFDLVDVPCINVYFGKRIAELGEFVDTVHALQPDKPLIITEFGHESVRGLHGEGYGTEDEQAAVLESNWQVFHERADFIPGALIWCLADYWHMPAGPDFRWMNRIYFCHGVTTLNRRSKLAVDTVKRIFDHE